jgi:hypothetical protein
MGVNDNGTPSSTQASITESTYYASSTKAVKMFDNVIGDHTQGWHTGSSVNQPHYVKISFDSTKYITHFHLFGRTNSQSNQLSTTYHIYASNSAPSSVSNTSGMDLIFSTSGESYSNYSFSTTAVTTSFPTTRLSSTKSISESNRGNYQYYIMKMTAPSVHHTIGEWVLWEQNDARGGTGANSSSNTTTGGTSSSATTQGCGGAGLLGNGTEGNGQSGISYSFVNGGAGANQADNGNAHGGFGGGGEGGGNSGGGGGGIFGGNYGASGIGSGTANQKGGYGGGSHVNSSGSSITFNASTNSNHGSLIITKN